MIIGPFSIHQRPYIVDEFIASDLLVNLCELAAEQGMTEEEFGRQAGLIFETVYSCRFGQDSQESARAAIGDNMHDVDCEVRCHGC